MSYIIKHTKGDNKPYVVINGIPYDDLKSIKHDSNEIKDKISYYNNKIKDYEQRGFTSSIPSLKENLKKKQLELKEYNSASGALNNAISGSSSSSRGIGNTSSSATGK